VPLSVGITYRHRGLTPWAQVCRRQGQSLPGTDFGVKIGIFWEEREGRSGSTGRSGTVHASRELICGLGLGSKATDAIRVNLRGGSLKK